MKTAPAPPPKNASGNTTYPRRIAIINQKGGVGKTTTAVNLAHGIAMAGKRVLLIDLDPQGNATTALGVEKFTTKTSSYDLLVGHKGAAEGWTKSRLPNVDLFPANVSLVRAEMDLLNRREGRDTALKSAFANAKFPHDVVIIDAPPSLGILTLNILIAATDIIVPVQCEYLALEGLSMLLDTIDEIRAENNPGLNVLGHVLTMVDLRTNLSQAVLEDVRTHLKEKVFDAFIPRTIRLSECPSHGKTIFEYERWGSGARAYEALSKEVVKRLSAAPAAAKTAKGRK